MDFKSEWHRKSWDLAVRTTIPGMIGEFCKLSGYRFDHEGNCSIDILIDENPTGDKSEVSVVYTGIPSPDERGIFWIEGGPIVVVPVAEDETLNSVRCVGELLVDFLAERFVPATKYQLEDEASVRSWMPLDRLIDEFFAEAGQLLDATNFIAETTHLRRVVIERIDDVANHAQFGKTCPVEVPTGPMIGRVQTIATGAYIADGKIRKSDGEESPSHLLGPTATCVPFISRSEPARIVMGVNMMRQWIPPLEREPAVVRTGNEFEEEEFWCGITLYTAFMSFGRGNYEDGIILSRSGANRMRYASPVEIGDKISNRHGTKGVVARILPDEEMPRSDKGRVVECVFSFSGLYTRMNTGELWEAIYGLLVENGSADPRVAQFSEPSRSELSSMLTDSGLTNHGLVNMTLPDGTKTTNRVVAGPIYWGLTRHTVKTKLEFGGEDTPVMVQGEMEYFALRDCRAFASIVEAGTLTAEDGEMIKYATDAIQKGVSPKVEGRSMKARQLEAKARFLGIAVQPVESELEFSMIESTDDSDLELPELMRHPWSSRLNISRLARNTGAKQWPRLERSVERLRSLISTNAPEALIDSSRISLAKILTEYFNELVVHQDFVPRGKLYYSGKSVIVPGESISIRQIGIPADMAWVLFAPFVEAQVGPDAAKSRNDDAREALESVMANRWVRINRAPTLEKTAILAFKPVIVNHRAIEFHPLLCRWISGDFDGDQIAVFHPLTDEGQRDAEARLSVVGHLKHDPSLVRTLLPALESLWGLSLLSLSSGGDDRSSPLRKLLRDCEYNSYLTTRDLAAWAEAAIVKDGAENLVDRLEQLFDLGLDIAMSEGGSLDPFMTFETEEIEGESEARSREEVEEFFGASKQITSAPYSTQLLLAKCGARGDIGNLVSLTHSRKSEMIETKKGYLDGCSPVEYNALAMEAKRRIAEIVHSVEDRARPFNAAHSAPGFDVLARAARSTHPGFVITSAAVTNENDPIASVDARLFMGYMPK